MIGKSRILICLVFMLTAVSAVRPHAEVTADGRTKSLCRFGSVHNGGTDRTARRSRGHSYGKAVDLSAYGLDGELDYVHGMFYMARVKSGTTAGSADENGSPETGKKGTDVIVMYMESDSKKAKSVCRLKNGRTVYIPNSRLKVLYYLYNSASSYTDAQIEEWVRANGITSRTQYIFMVSKFNQRGWILERTNGKWECRYHLGVSTGSFTNGGLPNDCYGLSRLSINTHYKNRKNVGGNGKGISYASKGGGNQIHTGQMYHPYTHGCIATSNSNFSFIYNRLPYHTRVVLF